MTIGTRLRKVRKYHNLTLREVSKKAEVSIPHLSGMERDKINPSLGSIRKLAKAYNMTISDLLIMVD